LVLRREACVPREEVRGLAGGAASRARTILRRNSEDCRDFMVCRAGENAR